mgnify:CR=1 FL=1
MADLLDNIEIGSEVAEIALWLGKQVLRRRAESEEISLEEAIEKAGEQWKQAQEMADELRDL